jgi:hypothetical protein
MATKSSTDKRLICWVFAFCGCVTTTSYVPIFRLYTFWALSLLEKATGLGLAICVRLISGTNTLHFTCQEGAALAAMLSKLL